MILNEVNIIQKDFQIGGEEMIPTDFNEAHDYAKKIHFTIVRLRHYRWI